MIIAVVTSRRHFLLFCAKKLIAHASARLGRRPERVGDQDGDDARMTARSHRRHRTWRRSRLELAAQAEHLADLAGSISAAVHSAPVEAPDFGSLIVTSRRRNWVHGVTAAGVA
jgi:hypothetical protein